MKYGIVISAANTQFGELILKENLESNIAKASEFGYDGIELAVKDVKSLNIGKLHKLLDKYNLEMPVMGTGQIFFDDGLSFSNSKEEIRNEAVKRVNAITDIAGEFNSSVIIGLVRGTANINLSNNNEKEKEKALSRISDCLVRCLEYSMKRSVGFLIEPMHRYHTNLINTIDSAVHFINDNGEKLDIGRVGVLADTWHMNIEETDMVSPIIRNHKYITHIHFADSNRRAPGYGHIDFKLFCRVLREYGYDRYGSFEVFPWPAPDFCAKEAIDYMKKIEEQIQLGNDN
ncbi:hypothetical protein CVT91_03005 [Candidatus Atribacteria bacterium HGW-Atribacteria-1]|nr:MAG: hypothetical protein CVT91_03005 [Candidatus Atribacteria bacterium HGW-Atribacteria-1]